MKEFFEKNKIVLAIIVGALIIGGAIYFSGRKEKPPIEEKELTNEVNRPILRTELVGNKLVTKIIDGDTVIVEGGYSVRLLGIDADERGYPCYEEASKRLEELVLNKEVRLEKDQPDQDQYKRYLRYLFLDNQNINLQLVKEGLAVARFWPENEKYKNEIIEAEKEAMRNKVGCKWGKVKVKPEKEKMELQWEKLTSELTGLRVVGACQAGNYYGKEVIVEGKVVDTYRHLKSNTVFLNFEKPYPNQCFTAVIFSSDQYKFVESPEKYYSNKTVRVRGEIKEYKGKPQIILKEPRQIEIGK